MSRGVPPQRRKRSARRTRPGFRRASRQQLGASVRRNLGKEKRIKPTGSRMTRRIRAACGELLGHGDAHRPALGDERPRTLIKVLRVANDREEIRRSTADQMRQLRNLRLAQVDSECAAEVPKHGGGTDLCVARGELPARSALERASRPKDFEVGNAERRVISRRCRQKHLVIGDTIAPEISRRTGRRGDGPRLGRGAAARRLRSDLIEDGAEADGRGNPYPALIHKPFPQR